LFVYFLISLSILAAYRLFQSVLNNISTNLSTAFVDNILYPQCMLFLSFTGTIRVMPDSPIFKVAVPVPLYGLFDYLAPDHCPIDKIKPGCRVRVSFGRKSLIGLVVEQSAKSDVPLHKLKAFDQYLDDQPVISPPILKLLIWAAAYYQHPLGEVLIAALPKLLREGQMPSIKGDQLWSLSPEGQQVEIDALKRAPKQAQLIQLLQQSQQPASSDWLNAHMENWRTPLKALIKKQFIVQKEQACLMAGNSTPGSAPHLNAEQQSAVNAVEKGFNRFQPFLLQGITGSGKTEVYLSLVEKMLKQQKQVLILIPEISLTPQLTQRFQQRLNVPVASLHSSLNDRQRLCAWSMATAELAPVVIGTRSALFTPLPSLGLIIIDEEHDNSLKQQEGFRYHARDLAMVRARNADIPIVLGSATPALESLNNALHKHYEHLHLTQRANQAKPPKIHLLDVCRRPMQDNLSDLLLEKIDTHLQQQGQILLFLNRRGYAPLLMCHECGWTTECPRCDAHMTVHQQQKQLRCHHCGHEKQAPQTCPDCQNETLHVPGAGTERIEQALRQRFPDIVISRIDRDTTRRKGALDSKLEQARSGEARILIGTQMLAKGHDFPNVTLVGLVDVDQGLFSSDFRGTEHMAQLIVQVAGRAGRAQKPGEVYIQTHHPEHPLLQTLLNEGYEGFAKAALEERRQAHFPPYAFMMVLRAEATDSSASMQFLQQALDIIGDCSIHDTDAFGPLPAPMARRAGRYRAQLILQSAHRHKLHNLLRQWIPQLGKLKSANRVRWSIDVDPQDMY
jgi:primosomal protein N' (replication factor Y) (superfamily II helicase)